MEDSKDKSCSSGCCVIIGIIPWRLKGNVKGRMEKPESEKGTETRQINEWFKLGSMIDINTPLHSSQDGWRYTKEMSNY